jgi:hypothetical protein
VIPTFPCRTTGTTVFLFTSSLHLPPRRVQADLHLTIPWPQETADSDTGLPTAEDTHEFQRTAPVFHAR